MYDKDKSIAKFQKTKEEAIQLAGVNRDAVLLVTANPQIMALPIGEQQKKIHGWRNWLWANIYQRDPDQVVKQENKEKNKPSEELGF
jgi:hypothetical protein